MKTIARTRELHELVASWKRATARVALVPTMGNLHAGHADLVRRARGMTERVIVSIFVNPLQFGPNEDFAQYPRTPREDAALLESLGVDVLFAPAVEDMYPNGQAAATRVQVPGLSNILCGEFRPGHFDGVATVVTKLLNLVQPDMALFGEKDFQQLAIIRRAVADLCMPMAIVGVPTVREPDGLAMSSRNRYLTPADRAAAPRIHAELARARDAVAAGERNYAKLEEAGRTALERSGFRPDYFAVRDASTLQAPTADSRQLVILTAARIGKARLIDNVTVAI
ncbi:MAG TPA: pantoate--beta-alanine ligase [Steroidobacteraceae bacterium]|nr:pantoate--beta-alanine ligase [Steroidobacteraceae bacterium]